MLDSKSASSLVKSAHVFLIDSRNSNGIPGPGAAMQIHGDYLLLQSPGSFQNCLVYLFLVLTVSEADNKGNDVGRLQPVVDMPDRND